MNLYLCNGNVQGCSKKSCYLNGGECHHTSDPNYSISLPCNNESEFKFIKDSSGNF